MRHTTVLVIGMILLVLGVQGGIRLLVDRDFGLLAGLPGGFAAALACYAVAAAVGAFLAGRAGGALKKARAGE
jgi:hypothetical protein